MKAKSFLLLMMAAGCGLVAMYGVSQMNGQAGEESEMVSILVAKSEIEPYIPLTDDLVEFKEFPVELVPLGAIKTKEEYERRALRTRSFPGNPIVKANLGEKGDFDASTEIPDGYRVYTTPITQTSSHSGQIRPKDRVDIFVTYKAKNDKGTTRSADILKTKMILEYIEVFSMGGDRASDTPTNNDIVAKNASLLVTPKQAAILMMAESKGDLHLALRPKNETESVNVELLTEEDFDNLGTAKSIREELEEEHKQEVESLKSQLLADHQTELNKLKAENQRLMAALQAKNAGDEDTPSVVVQEVVEPEVWKIRVVNGKETEESEFVLGEEGEAVQKAPEKKPDTATRKESGQETSAIPQGAEENPMQSLLNRFLKGS